MWDPRGDIQEWTLQWRAFEMVCCLKQEMNISMM